jgi:uncharacterized protein (TIGR02466 family)
MEMKATMLWGTPLVEVANPQHAAIKDDLVSYARQRERQAKAAIESGVTPAKKQGMYESTFDLFRQDVPAIRQLANFCAQAVVQCVFKLRQQAAGGREAVTGLGVDIHESWIHITRDGGQHEIHNHPNCSWCGIYYVDIGDATLDPPNGVNRFFPPIDILYEDAGTLAYPQKPVSYPPADGKLVLFPSYVRHSASPYHGQRDRVLVAFNARLSAPPR